MFDKFLDFVKSPEYIHKAVELTTDSEFTEFSDELFFIVHHDLSILYGSLEE